MALARRRRFTAEIGINVPRPQVCVFEEVGDAIGSLGGLEVVCELVEAVEKRNADGERLKFSSEGIE